MMKTLVRRRTVPSTQSSAAARVTGRLLTNGRRERLRRSVDRRSRTCRSVDRRSGTCRSVMPPPVGHEGEGVPRLLDQGEGAEALPAEPERLQGGARRRQAPAAAEVGELRQPLIVEGGDQRQAHAGDLAEADAGLGEGFLELAEE